MSSPSTRFPEKESTFDDLGVHPKVVTALKKANMTRGTQAQCDILRCTCDDMSDVLAEVQSGDGRYALMGMFAQHCVLNSEGIDFPFVAVITANDASRSKFIKEMSKQKIDGLDAVEIANTNRRPSDYRRPCIFVTSFAIAMRWEADMKRCCTVIMEGANQFKPDDVERLLDATAKRSPEANFFLLTTVPPCDVDPSLRYILGRKKRRYRATTPSGPVSTYLLANSEKDRTMLVERLLQIKEFSKVLLLTHNREVRQLSDYVGKSRKTMEVRRNATNAERFATITDFLGAPSAVLVAMDMYTGIDLLDVNAVIQFYPPQKSVPDEDWEDYVNCVTRTAASRGVTNLITLVGPEDMTLAQHCMERLGCEPLMLNLSPTHPKFAEIVRQPILAALTQVNRRAEVGSSGTNSVSPTASAAEAIPLPRSKQDDGPTTPVSNAQALRDGGKKKGKEPPQKETREMKHQQQAAAKAALEAKLALEAKDDELSKKKVKSERERERKREKDRRRKLRKGRGKGDGDSSSMSSSCASTPRPSKKNGAQPKDNNVAAAKVEGKE